ncbi:MAG TPA: ACP S-malonyltransferase [Nitrospirota bacterium]|jgi:[acyl-carrier-protein] S-malonyltransferase
MGVAFIFPGQGSQYLGMGKSLAEAFPEARAVFEEASESVGYDILKLCVEGPEAELNRTENTQPAILTVSLAAFAALKAGGITPIAAAGHSLGELTAVAAAGGLTVGQAASLASRRGRYMQEAVPQGKGLMAAVLGLDADKVREACVAASGIGVVAPANFNSPGQIVIAGVKEAVEKAGELCKEFGAKKVVPLAVSVPSHCPLMAPAADRLKADLAGLEMQDLKFPVASNAYGRLMTSSSDVKEALVKQLTEPLLWVDCVEAIVAAGVSDIIEAGPGKVLSGLVKRITDKAVIKNAEDGATMTAVLEALKS